MNIDQKDPEPQKNKVVVLRYSEMGLSSSKIGGMDHGNQPSPLAKKGIPISHVTSSDVKRESSKYLDAHH